MVGFVAVELWPAGTATAPLPGYGRQQADIIVGNFLARPCTWRGGNASLAGLAGQEVQLHVAFAAAKIYSFQFVCAGRRVRDK